MISFNRQLEVFPTPIRTLYDEETGNRIHVKLESMNPSGSIKDRVFNYVLKKMESEGRIKIGDTLIIASSGNAAISLATFAKSFGYHTKVFMPSSTSLERRQIMNVMQVPSYYVEGGMKNTIERAKREALLERHHYIDQFFDPTFLGAHQDTADEIASSLTDIDYFICGVGTGVTINALGRKLKAKFPDLKIVAFEPDEARSLSISQYGPHGLEGVGPNFEPINFHKDEVEKIIPITKDEAYTMAIRLAKNGYNYGITTASGLVAAQKLKIQNKDILIINYDSNSKYIKVLEEYAKTH